MESGRSKNDDFKTKQNGMFDSQASPPQIYGEFEQT
jgi:hypothetical protein